MTARQLLWVFLAHIAVYALFAVCLYVFIGRAQAASRFSMEAEELMVRAALCQPTSSIPAPCQRRTRRRK